MPRRKFSDEWYIFRNPLPSLKEYWYQQYVMEHPAEFGFKDLDGPFDTGPDFTALLDGKSVKIEVEKDYYAFASHEHPMPDVLLVGVMDEPPAAIRGSIPSIIKHLDPQVVLEWSSPRRRAYKEKMDIRRADRPSLSELLHSDPNIIAARRTNDERWEVVRRPVYSCSCGGQMIEEYLDLDGMTEGQMADYQAENWSIVACQECGNRRHIQY